MSVNHARKILLAIALAALCFSAACEKPSKPGGEPVAEVADSTFRGAGANVATREILEAGARSSTLAEIRDSGLLIAALECETPQLCSRNDYGVAMGFEVDLLKQAAQLFGVKLNVVQPGTRAHLDGPASPENGPGASTTRPYFYSVETGWLSFRIENDPAFAATMDLVIRHLYETGTYQQLYNNWFVNGNMGETAL